MYLNNDICLKLSNLRFFIIIYIYSLYSFKNVHGDSYCMQKNE